MVIIVLQRILAISAFVNGLKYFCSWKEGWTCDFCLKNENSLCLSDFANTGRCKSPHEKQFTPKQDRGVGHCLQWIRIESKTFQLACSITNLLDLSSQAWLQYCACLMIKYRRSVIFREKHFHLLEITPCSTHKRVRWFFS